MTTTDILLGLKAIVVLMVQIFITVISVLAGIAKAFLDILTNLK
jgi:hypothetical protein